MDDRQDGRSSRSEEFGTAEVPRTDLAWSRTGLALVVSAMAVIKLVVDLGDYRAPVLIFAFLLAGTLVWVLSYAHGARRLRRRPSKVDCSRDQHRLRRVAAITMIFAVGALVIALLPQR